MPMIIKSVFLDRDGVINEDYGYVGHWKNFKFCPGALSALRLLTDRNVNIIVITNQSGIARGFYSEQEYEVLNEKMLEVAKQHGINVLAVYHCPHHPMGKIKRYAIDCNCRKPKSGMILEALDQFVLDPGKSIMIGDKQSDCLSAAGAGINRFFHINSNSSSERDFSFPSLQMCVNFLDNSPSYDFNG
jgi:D-glycero-D-manno-heptose 1,7-bisphosphate phosphatase